MTYIDGFLIPVRNEDRETYRAHEEKWWHEFRALGALTLVAGWGDDVPVGKQTDFLRAVELREGETVVFCWMTWPDKATRNKAYATMAARAETDRRCCRSLQRAGFTRRICGFKGLG